MAKLSVNCSFIQEVAAEHGIPAAILFSHIDWSLDSHRSQNQAGFYFQGKWWMYDTIKSLHDRFYFLGEATIKRALLSLKQAGLIFNVRIRSRENSSYYSIDYAAFQALKNKNSALEAADLRDQNDLLDNLAEKAKGSKCTLSKKLRDQNDLEQGIKMIPSSLSTSHTTSQGETISQKGGNARAHVLYEGKSVVAEAPPSFKNVIPFPSGVKETPAESPGEDFDFLTSELDRLSTLREENGDLSDEEFDYETDLIDRLVKITPSKVNKKAPPEPENGIREVWHRHNSQTLKSVRFDIGKYKTAIDEILAKTNYTENDIARIFHFIRSGKDRLVSARFKFPWDWNRPWSSKEGALNFIDETYSLLSEQNRKWK